MNTVQGVIKMYLRDKWSWFIVPWFVLLSSFIVNFCIAAFLPIEEKIVTGGLASIFVYMMVNGIISMSQTFPFALGMSVRRRDFFQGSMFMIMLVSAAISVILYLLSYIEGNVIDGWGVSLYFFHLPFVSEGNALAQMLVSFSLLLNMYMIGFLSASIHRRFGRFGMYVASIAVILILTFLLYAANYFEWWSSIFSFFSGHSAVVLACMLLPITAGLALAAYVLLRRATV